MPLIIASHDSLPYIEPAPTAEELVKINSLISAELLPNAGTTPHALLPPLARESFTPLIAQELERVAAGRPMEGGIDLERYDPTASSDLVAAYSSAVHLSTRLTNLSLLAEFGKNAWLLHNSQLEELLKKEEEKLMALRTEVEVCNKERKGAQVDVQGEMKRLEERWKKAVCRVLEVELVTEGLRREILEKQQAGAR